MASLAPTAQVTAEKTQPNASVAAHDAPGLQAPPSPSIHHRHHLFHRNPTPDDSYFTGPRNLQSHSKWPLIMQLHGSIIPKLMMPLFLIAAWSTTITCIHRLVHPLAVHSVLLTILGFVVGLSLSFRSSTAYERYGEGRRYWGQITSASQTLGRIFWIHAIEPAGQDSREVVLKKVGAMNLIVAFSLALKHTLRFEPCGSQPELRPFIAPLDTIIVPNRDDDSPERPISGFKSMYHRAGEYLGIPFATSNPRKAVKKAQQHQGNLPLEILSHLGVALDATVRNKQLPVLMQQTLAYNNLTLLNDAMVGCERVLNTPLPIAYTIAISQITFFYVFLLPFQLVGPLKWVAIPATIAAAYIILGLLFIGQEIENPFGHDVNDLPLETYCDQIASDMDIIASFDTRQSDSFLLSSDCVPLHPVSGSPPEVWMDRSVDKLRQAIKEKPRVIFDYRRGRGRKGDKSGQEGSQTSGRDGGMV